MIKRFCSLLLSLMLGISAVTISYGAESEKPQLLDVVLYETSVCPGQSVHVGMDAWCSGNPEQLSMTFLQEETGSVLALSLRSTAPGSMVGQRYEGNLTLPENAAPGRYSLRTVTLMDSQGNRIRYTSWDSGEELLSDVLDELPAFTVVSGSGRPLLTGCSVSPASLTPGEEATVSLQTSLSASELERASLLFRNEDNGHVLVLSLEEEDWVGDGMYQKTLEIPPYEEAGSFQLVKATIKNSASGEQTWSHRLHLDDEDAPDQLPIPFQCGFQVTGTSRSDASAPVLSSVTVTDIRQKIDSGDLEYHLEARASDDRSGAARITLLFRNSANDRTLSAVLWPDDEDSQLFTGTMTVSSWEPAGAFFLEQAGVTDEAGNFQSYRNAWDLGQAGTDLPLPQGLTIEVNTGSEAADDTAPVLESLSLDRQTISRGETVAVTAKVSDDLSGVKDVSLQFRSRSDSPLSLVLHQQGDAWVGAIKDTQKLELGQYRLTRVTLRDEAGNRRGYYESPGSYSEGLPVSLTFVVED